MENMNHEPQDGKLLRGMSPLELWAEHNPQLRSIPNEAKWLYRSAMSVSKVTSNGVRISRGSGPKMEVFYYDSPAHLVPLQGRKVIVHWNDGNPDADAIVRLPMPGSAPKFLCIASRVQPLQRFTATPEQLSVEAKRKKAAMRFARTELRSIQPELVRASRPILIENETAALGAVIADATERAGAVNAAGRAGAGAAADATAGEVRQLRGARAVVRAAITSFGNQPFSLEDVRAKIPGPLKTGASTVLHQLTIHGELRKTRRADNSKVWQATAGLRTREANLINAGPQPGSLVDAGNGKKTYILDGQ